MAQMRTFYRFALALLCCAPLAGCGGGPEPDPGEAPFCGGFAGFQCPGVGTCVDDPRDDCDPNDGGADCGGICLCVEDRTCDRGSRFDASPEVCDCVPREPINPCAAVLCQVGTVCEVRNGEGVCVSDGSQECGDTTCGKGTVCCNASCGMCVPPGRACIQIACE